MKGRLREPSLTFDVLLVLGLEAFIIGTYFVLTEVIIPWLVIRRLEP